MVRMMLMIKICVFLQVDGWIENRQTHVRERIYIGYFMIRSFQSTVPTNQSYLDDIAF